MKYLISTFLLLCFYIVDAQEYKGFVIDESNKPIPFATVTNVETGLGVITNEEGYFVIHTLQKQDTLQFRCLGYERCYYPLNKPDSKEPLKIVLKESVYYLSELEVLPENAKELVLKSKAKIRKNYPTNWIQLSGVFKQITEEDEHCKGFFEANSHVYFKSIGGNLPSKVETEIRSYRFYKEVSKAFFVTPESYLNIFHVNYHSFLSQISDYKFWSAGVVQYDNKPIMKVRFEPQNRKRNEKQYAGNVYIDLNSHAFVYFDYYLLPLTCDYYYYGGTYQKPTERSIKVMYASKNGEYVPEYVIVRTSSKLKSANSGVFDQSFKLTSGFNFFAMHFQKGYPDSKVSTHSFSKIVYEGIGNVTQVSKDYKNTYVYNTRKENIFINGFLP